MSICIISATAFHFFFVLLLIDGSSADSMCMSHKHNLYVVWTFETAIPKKG